MSDQQSEFLPPGMHSEPMFEKKSDPELIAEDDFAEGVKALADHFVEKWRAEGKTDNSESPMIDRGYKKPDGSPVEPDKVVTVRENAEALGKAYERDAEQLKQQADTELANQVDDARTQWHYENNPEFRAQADALLQQQAQAGEFADIKTQADINKLASEDQPRFVRWQAHMLAREQQAAPVEQQPADPNDEFVKAWQSTDPRVKAALEAQVEQVTAAQRRTSMPRRLLASKVRSAECFPRFPRASKPKRRRNAGCCQCIQPDKSGASCSDTSPCPRCHAGGAGSRAGAAQQRQLQAQSSQQEIQTVFDQAAR